MLHKKEFRNIAVGGNKYLCTIWYRGKDKMWFGEALETNRLRVFCCADSKREVLRKLRVQIGAELKRLR